MLIFEKHVFVNIENYLFIVQKNLGIFSLFSFIYIFIKLKLI
jgi:hypothetical protein